MKIFKNKVVIGACVVLLTAALGAALGPWVTVSSGTVKVPSLMGKVQPIALEEGFHIVNPLLSFDEYDVKQKAYELPNVTIPSKDKFKSDASVTIMWSIDASYTPKLRQTVGDMVDVEHKLLRQPVMSLLREAGRSVEKAQDLFNAETQQRLQDEISDGLIGATQEYGISIHAVYIQDITLPQVIKDSIVTTKKLEEQEAQEQARLKQQELIYARDTAQAEAKAKAAEHNKQARQFDADAKAYETERNADAELYAAEKQAEANTAIAASITDNLLALRDKEIEMKRAENWQGGVPSHVFGEGGNVVPLYHMNEK